MSPPPRHVYLIDGSGFIFRAFHALPPMTRADGTPVNAVLGFSNMLMKLLTESDADHIAVVFDAGSSSFRNRMYDAYKAHRPELPPELIPQFRLIREATEAFNVAQVELEDYEADDLIATYAREAVREGAEVTIVSSDKDLMQLVGDKVVMLDPIKNKAIGVPEVQEKFGVTPDKVVYVQALCGDSVDNVPGVPGIGVKTAAELIGTFGDLESLLARAPAEVKQPKRRQSLIDFADQARLSLDLVRLKEDVPLPYPLGSFALRRDDPEKLLSFLREQGFRSVITRYEQRLRDAGTPAAPLPAEPKAVQAHYALIDSLDELGRWLAVAHEQGVLAFALRREGEATVAEPLAGLAIAVAPGLAGYIPLGHASAAQATLGEEPGVPYPRLQLDVVMEQLRPVLAADGVLKVAHNMKDEMRLLGGLGLSVAPYDCAMLMSYVLEGGSHSHHIEELAQRYLEATLGADPAGSGRTRVPFRSLSPASVLAFACERADMALRLHRRLKPRLVQEKLTTLYETVERPMPAVIARMEEAGIKVDRAELLRLAADFTGRLADLETEIHELAGRSFNIGSPKQLGEILFDELKLAGGKKGKTGAYGTDAALLEQLAASHALPARVLDWRQIAKLKSTYVDALLEQMNAGTDRVHTSFSLAATTTGRLSSTDPNVQNIPIRTEEGRKIRRAFVAEPGHVLLSADYSQIELRLAAHVADIDALKTAFQNGIDIHALTASEVFGVPVEGMPGEVRRRAKAINFGIIYGISAFGLAAQLSIPQGEAAAYIRAYMERFPSIRTYMEETKAFARENGFVETLFGRKCFMPGVRDSNPARRSGAERQAINAPLQGSAADIVKRAMARLPAALSTAGLKARMLLQVHDELLFEVPENQVEETAHLVKAVMEGAPHPARRLDVPLVVETGTGANWGDAH